jgi:hypothetical protein
VSRRFLGIRKEASPDYRIRESFLKQRFSLVLQDEWKESEERAFQEKEKPLQRKAERQGRTDPFRALGLGRMTGG